MFTICDRVNDDWMVVGIGGLSDILTVNGSTDVPLTFVPEMVSEYDIFRYAPVIVNVDPEMVADVWGFVKSAYEVA